MYLIDCNAEIDRHLVSLQGWAASMNEAKQSLAAFIASSEYKDFLKAQLLPSEFPTGGSTARSHRAPA